MYMAAAGLKVLVIEKFASAGQGSNKAAIGGVRATHSDPAKIRLGLRSVEIFSTWEQTHGQDIEWRSGGYCFVAYTESDERKLKDLLNIQQSFGLNISLERCAGNSRNNPGYPTGRPAAAAHSPLKTGTAPTCWPIMHFSK